MSDNLHKIVKADSRARSVMSFLLFVFVTILSILLCAKSVFIDVDFIKSQFISYDYISSLNENISDYISDEFVKNGISNENVDKLITYSFCEELVDQYISGQIDSDSGFTAQSVEQSVDNIKDNLILEIEQQVKNAGLKYNKDAGERLVENICAYINSQISIQGIERAKAIINVASVALIVGIIVLFIFVAVFCAITFFIGKVRYRSVRAISIGFLSSGVFQVLMSIVVYIIFYLKHIDIYPLYLRGALMSYIYGSAQAVALYGAGLIIISFVLSTLVWRMKKKTT